MSLLTSQQRTELIARLTGDQVTRTTAGPVTTEFAALSASEILRILQADSANTAISARKRPFLLQQFVSPGATSRGLGR